MNENDAKTLLELAETISTFGTWEFDIKARQMIWSDGVFKICGYLPGEFELTFESSLSFIHPEDRASVLEKMTEAIEKGTPYETKKRFISKNKKIVHVLLKGIVSKDNAGKP